MASGKKTAVHPVADLSSAKEEVLSVPTDQPRCAHNASVPDPAGNMVRIERG